MRKLHLIYLLGLFVASCGTKGSDSIDDDINNKHWKGAWERVLLQNDASLEIKDIIKDSIVFSLSASSGANMGDVEGKAVIKGNKAVYLLNTDYDTCLLEFEIFGDTLITIDQIKGNCFAGMGVYYSGKYFNAKLKSTIAALEAQSPENITLLEDPTDDSLFRALVGNDYALFVNSTQLTSEDEDLDSLNTKVYASAVRGLYTFMENIIMVDTNSNIWAAVINDKEVFYYTNRADYKKTLPKTIEHWRERFKELPVIFKSAE